MRIKDIRDPYELINIKDDDCFKWKLDYSIHHNYYKHLEEDGCKYDYIDSEVIIWNTELCYIINNEFNLSLIPESSNKVSKELANKIWRYVDKRGSELHLTGSYGDNF